MAGGTGVGVGVLGAEVGELGRVEVPSNISKLLTIRINV